jgi:hypothetical protein
VAGVIRNPVFVVSPPRSGSTLLFETLSLSPDLWTVGGESHQIIEGVPALRPAAGGWDSNVLTEEDADPRTAAELRRRFVTEMRDFSGRRPGPGERPMRLLEKTPRNALRIRFLVRVFPRAQFVYLHREAEPTIASMIDGWESGRYVSYGWLPGWTGPPWSFLLTPGWRELAGRPLYEVVAHQWAQAATLLLDDLATLPRSQWTVARYESLVADPNAEVERLCEFLGLAWDEPLGDRLPLSVSTLTPPDPDKWRRLRDQLEAVADLVRPVKARAEQVATEALTPTAPV